MLKSSLPNINPISGSPTQNVFNFTSSTKTTHQTTTIKTTESINTIVQKQPTSPVHVLSPITTLQTPDTVLASTPNHTSQKLKSWTNLNSININNEAESGGNKATLRDRTPTPENRNSNNVLTNWKSTASNNEKQLIIIDKSKEINDSGKPISFINNNNNNNKESPRPNSELKKLHRQETEIKLSPGKLVDAVKAASDAGLVEEDLALITEFNKNSPGFLGKSNNYNQLVRTNNGYNLGYIEDKDKFNKFPTPTPNQNDYLNQKKKMIKKNSIEEDTFSSSSLSSCSDSESIIKKKSSNLVINNSLNNINNINNNEFKIRRQLTGINPPILITKKSASAENNLNYLNSHSKQKFLSRNNSEENFLQRDLNSINSKDLDRPANRPRGRLNFYDSDTFSEGFLISGSQAINKNLKKNGLIF